MRPFTLLNFAINFIEANKSVKGMLYHCTVLSSKRFTLDPLYFYCEVFSLSLSDTSRTLHNPGRDAVHVWPSTVVFPSLPNAWTVASGLPLDDFLWLLGGGGAPKWKPPGGAPFLIGFIVFDLESYPTMS